MRKKKDPTDEAHDFSGMPAVKPVTAEDIQAKEFAVSRFGGYRMRDVDEFLDELTASMTKLTEENERLRSGAILPADTIGAPDLEDSSRQADEIIERARAEAARIVQEAQDRVAMAAATAGSATLSQADRAAVTAFLSRERDFLQGLATLVQSHAEAIKGMAKATRPGKPAETAKPAEGPPAEGARASERAKPAETAKPSEAAPAEAAKSAVPPEPSKAEQPAATETTTARIPEPGETEEPVRVEDPAPAAVSRTADDEEPDPEGDRSLRDLFWGED